MTSQPTIKEEPVDIPAQTPTCQVPQSTIKEEPVEGPAFPKIKKPQPEIIILDDTPPRPTKRAVTNVSNLPTPTIKAEPIDLDNLPAPTSTSNPANTNGAPAKKIKLEPGVQPIDLDDDQELVRLKEEEVLLDQELQIAQRMAQLIREKKEQKKRIAALEARSSGTPGRGARS